MTNIINYQVSENQNQNEITSHLFEGLVSKRQEMTNAGKGVEKRETVHHR